MLNYNIILCGGTGVRLCPLSSKACPKQFMEILDNNTLLDNTINRFSDYSNIDLSTNIAYKQQLPKNMIILKKSMSHFLKILHLQFYYHVYILKKTS